MLLCFRFLIWLFFSNFLCFCNLRFFFFLTFCEPVCLFKDVILCVKVIYIIGKAFCWCYLSGINFFYHRTLTG